MSSGIDRPPGPRLAAAARVVPYAGHGQRVQAEHALNTLLDPTFNAIRDDPAFRRVLESS